MDAVNKELSAAELKVAIERLSTSKKKHYNEESLAGSGAGRDWAMKRAEYDELKRVAEYEFEMEGEGSHRPSELYSVIANEPITQGGTDAEEFWRAEAGTADPSELFVFAFAAAAADVYGAVEERL